MVSRRCTACHDLSHASGHDIGFDHTLDRGPAVWCMVAIEFGT
jgi:hypothetical protein